MARKSKSSRDTALFQYQGSTTWLDVNGQEILLYHGVKRRLPQSGHPRITRLIASKHLTPIKED